MAKKPRPAGPEREADGDLPLPVGGASQQQIGDIDASDEKHESNVLLKAVDRALLPYAQINDSSILGNNGILPGEGDVPLYDYLDALPDGIDLSTEAQFPSDYTYTGAEWAKITVERTRRLLQRYYASKK